MSFAGNSQSELNKRDLWLFSQTLPKCPACNSTIDCCFCRKPELEEGINQTEHTETTSLNRNIQSKLAIIEVLIADIKNEIKLNK
jgi:hypothetical protein